jgi:ATPase subunit of ABC transporter with duplicated ATPase domains
MVKINHEGGRQVNSRAYLSRFNFGGSDQNKKVSTLSGGERNPFTPCNDFKGRRKCFAT